MKQAAAYIRVSTDDQIEFSPDSQLKALKNYADKNNMLLSSEFVFIDEGISGKSTSKRNSFNKMIALAKTKPKPFDVILVWKYSRFARNREDSVVYKSMLRKQLNIDVVSISEDVGDEKMSIIFEAMIEAMDEYYSINLAEEVKRGMTEKAKRGGVLSIPAYGYRVADGRYEIIEEEAVIIRKVFNDYLNGSGFLKIAKELNAMNIRTHRGNRIENRTVEYWLNNPVYIGKTRWNPVRATSRNYHDENIILSDGTHEPIIDINTWEIVQQKMKNQKEHFLKNYTSQRDSLSHWCVGIARCGACGATLSNAGGTFICSKKCKGLCSGNGTISVKKLERIVIGALESILSGENTKIDTTPIIKPNMPENNKEIILETEIKRAEIRLERIKDAYENGIDTLEEYKANKKKLLNEIDELKKGYLEELSKKETTKNPKKTLKICNFMEIIKDKNISHSEKNKLARLLLKEVTKTGEDGKTIWLIFWE